MGYYFYPPPRPWQKLRRVLPSGPVPAVHAIPAAAFPYPTVFINGTAYSIQQGSLHVTRRIGAESTASFTILDPSGTIAVEDHMEATIITGTTAYFIFGGFIQSVQATNWLPSGSRRIKVECHGYRYLAERRIASASFGASTVLLREGDLDDLLADDFVATALNGLSAGAAGIDAMSYNYRTVAEILDDHIRVASGFSGKASYWTIRPRMANIQLGGTPTRDLDFLEVGHTAHAASDIETSDVLLDSLQVQYTSPAYRNREINTDAKRELTGQVEVMLGDGQRRAFTVGYEIASTPTVEEDRGAGYVSKTVGIKGVETGKDWYWNEGSEVVVQDSGGTALAGTHKLRISYDGLGAIVVIASNSGEISRIALLEGSSGRVDVSRPQGDIIGQTAVEDLARGLAGRARRGVRVTFETRETTVTQNGPIDILGVGVNVNIPGAGIDNLTMAHEQVEVFDDPVNALYGVRYRLTLVAENAVQAAWQEAFRPPQARLNRLTNILEVTA